MDESAQGSERLQVFGIPLEDLRDYAAQLGNYCDEQGFPYLNSLIVSSQTGMSGEDFFTWAGEESSSWGEYAAACFEGFHIPSDNAARYQNVSGINDSILTFLNG